MLAFCQMSKMKAEICSATLKRAFCWDLREYHEPRFWLTLKYLAGKLISVVMEQIRTNNSTLGTITQDVFWQPAEPGFGFPAIPGAPRPHPFLSHWKRPRVRVGLAVGHFELALGYMNQSPADLRQLLLASLLCWFHTLQRQHSHSPPAPQLSMRKSREQIPFQEEVLN